jgi:hypothetical protein
MICVIFSLSIAVVDINDDTMLRVESYISESWKLEKECPKSWDERKEGEERKGERKKEKELRENNQIHSNGNN